MDPVVVIMVLLSALMHALRNFFNKRALDKQAFTWWFEIFGLLFFTPVFIFVFIREGLCLSISPIFILLSGIAHFVYWLLLTISLEKGDLSLVYPIMRSSPALVLIFSVTVLKENISTLGVLGILLVAIGVYAIHLKKFGFHELTQPFRLIASNRAIQFAVLTLISVASYSVIDKMAVSHMSPVAFAYLYPWITLSFFTFYLFKTKSRSIIKREWRVHKRSILACGFLGIFGYFLILLAFTTERVSYVVGLRQFSIVFAVLLGGHFLKEKHLLIRITSSLIIFLGCYFIIIAE
jgi:uncharacterized membrane protein